MLMIILSLVAVATGEATGPYPPAEPSGPYPPAAPYPAASPLEDRYTPAEHYGAPPLEHIAALPTSYQVPLVPASDGQDVLPAPHSAPVLPSYYHHAPSAAPLAGYNVRYPPIADGSVPSVRPFYEGGNVSPLEQSPVAPNAARVPSNILPAGPLSSLPAATGGDLSPEQLEIPPNTQIKLQDDRLQYSHGFSDGDGTRVSEQGSLLTTNGGWEYVIAKKGSYSYVSPEGKQITVNYIADDKGFRVLPN